MNAKYISIIALPILAIAIYFTPITWFRNEEAPTIDSLRTEAKEAIKREEEATKARLEAEDKLSQAIYDSCYHDSLTNTGATFDQKQRKAYDCWKQELANTNGTGKLAPASEPPLGTIILQSHLYAESAEKKASTRNQIDSTQSVSFVINNSSSNVTNKSTVGSSDPTASRDRSKIHATIQAQGKQVAILDLNRGKVPKGQILPQPGKTSSKGKESNCLKKTILTNGWNDPRVQFAYDISCGNMDFIKTIEAESRWDVNASGDSHKAFGLCQINKLYNPEMQKEYRNLKSDNEKVSFCYDQYQDWVKRGVIKTRLYGYNVRNLPTNSKPFTFK